MRKSGRWARREHWSRCPPSPDLHVTIKFQNHSCDCCSVPCYSFSLSAPRNPSASAVGMRGALRDAQKKLASFVHVCYTSLTFVAHKQLNSVCRFRSKSFLRVKALTSHRVCHSRLELL